MRIFLAGAGGAVGKRLVPLLLAGGHEVTGTTTSEAKLPTLRTAGVNALLLDLLDRNAVMTAVMRAEPDAVIHQATSLSSFSQNMRKIDRTFEVTNRLRTEGTDHLLAAARAAGARRLIAQSYTGWPNPRSGKMVKTEEDPLDPNPLPALRAALDGIRHVDTAVPAAEGIEGVVLRYGSFYGPGTSMGGDDSEFAVAIRKRRFPIVGEGTGVWSLIHIDDAAAATALAVERGAPGLYNITDDDPAPVCEWLPELARVLGAKPPRRLPVWLARIVAGEVAVAVMTEIRGSSNAKAKRELGWQPLYPSWRDGFRALTDDTARNPLAALRAD